ncbi:MAG: helix-turn-helix transcriptional regulator [Acidobacteriota bacterium]
MTTRALVAASAKPIVLSLLITGESYGYQILQRVRLVSGGTLKWSSAMLYPVLHRLEKDGLIRSEWKPSEEGRMRKYYMLTDLGREEFVAEKEQWFGVHDALKKFWARAEALENVK